MDMQFNSGFRSFLETLNMYPWTSAALFVAIIGAILVNRLGRE